MIYLQLFISFLKIGLFSIGGGYAALPLIKNEVVTYNEWLSLSMFTDIITISEMTPGPIAINSATFVGIQIGGIRGAIVATTGFVLPSIIIVMSLAHIYYKYKSISVVDHILQGLRPAVVSLIGAAGVTILILAIWNGGVPSWDIKDINIISVIIFAVSIFCLKKFKPNPIFIILGSGVFGGIIYSII